MELLFAFTDISEDLWCTLRQKHTLFLYYEMKQRCLSLNCGGSFSLGVMQIHQVFREMKNSRRIHKLSPLPTPLNKVHIFMFTLSVWVDTVC